MKKTLFNLGLFLLAANCMVAQQNKSIELSSNHPVKARANTRSTQRTNGTQPVPTTTATGCMSINYPTVTGWTPSLYTTGTAGAGGFVSGPNQYGDKEKAMYFDASASSFVNLYQVDVWFAKGYSSNPAKVVNMKIYDGTSGSPSASVIATASITMGSIMSDVANNFNTSFYFPAGVALPASKKFFCSVDISNLNWTTSKDSLAIVSNQSGQTTPAAAWEKQSTNTWYPYSAAAAWTQSVSLYIHPFLRNTPVTASFTASNNSICAGKSITYDATGSTTGGVTYWSFGATATPTTASTTTASASYAAAGTYTTLLIVLDACDALAAAQGTIQVKANPTVSATPASTVVCSGTNISLTGGGATSYSWSGGITNGVSFAPSTTVYTVTGTAANGCTNTAVASVTVNNLPNVSATPASTAVCVGTNLTLTGGGATTYTWTGGVTNGVSFAPTSTDYTVTGTDVNGCKNTAVASVTVNTLPNVTATPASTAVCAGTNVTLTGGGSATTFTWTGGVTNGTPFAPATADYTVSGTDGNGCVNSAVASVTVNALPNVTATPSSTVVCAGTNITLTAGGAATTYTWSNGVIDGAAFVPTSNDYTVTGTDANGCVNTAVASVTVNSNPTVLANASASVICTGENVTLTGSGATSYTWSAGVVDGVAFAPTSTDTYTVTGDANGCTGTATVEVTVSLCTGISSVSASNSAILIYPNPNNGDFTIKAHKAETIVIVNELGQFIQTVELTQSNDFSFKVFNLQAGIYFLNGQTTKQKIVVTH
ncbi:MAG: T9SS type A sorting domain-containing protein [Bacteroidetes bacterium]|nr:T9SS type A sorting domain-containing protein [Bacteroidota bacterium]